MTKLGVDLWYGIPDTPPRTVRVCVDQSTGVQLWVDDLRVLHSHIFGLHNTHEWHTDIDGDPPHCLIIKMKRDLWIGERFPHTVSLCVDGKTVAVEESAPMSRHPGDILKPGDIEG